MGRAWIRRASASLLAFSLAGMTAFAAEEPSQAPPPPDPVPSAQPAAPAPVLVYPAPLWPEDGIWSVVRPRLGAQYITGPGMGYSNGFTALEGFVPIYGASPEHLIYTDLRGIISDQSALWGNNVGAGYRYFNNDLDRIFGAWTAWDMRNTGLGRYNQISGGGETIGRYLDFRSNFYAIVGPQSTTVDQMICAPFFQGTNIFSPRVIGTESGLTGWDMEVGGPVPLVGRYGVRAYVGGYAYHGNVVGDFGGVQGRFQARLNNNIECNLQLRNDPLFGTTVAFGGALRWGGVRREYQDRDRQSVFNRYADPVQRNYNVSVGTNVQYIPNQILTDPTTGQPITVIHVNHSAPVNGDGSFEHPIQFLAPASGLAGVNGIILVYRGGDGSTFRYDQGIVLQNGQRLLGNSLVYPFLSRELGLCNLPNVQDGRPTITNVNQGSPAVLLANGNEVAGMNIGDGSLPIGAQGILGTGINNFNIHDINVDLAQGDGILLASVAGTGMISNVVVTNSLIGGNGLNMSTSGGSVLTAQVLNSSFNTNSANGVLLTTNDTSVMNALFQGGNKLGNTNAGLSTVSNGTSTLNVSVVSDPITGNGGNGIRMRAFDTSTTNATVTGNTITGNGRNGIAMTSRNQSTINATISGNFIDGNSRNGVRLTSRNQSTLNATVDGNTLSNNGGAGARVVSRNQSFMNATFSNNFIDSNFDDGIFFHERGNSTMTAVVTGNNIRNSGIDGVFAQFDGLGQTFIATNNTVFNSFDHGIHVDMLGDGTNTQNVTITGNNIDGGTIGGDFGILASVVNGSTANVNISNNTVINEVTGGIAGFVLANDAITLTANGNSAGETSPGALDGGIFGIGLAAVVGPNGTITANVTGNSTNGNAVFGTGVALVAVDTGNINANVNNNTANDNGVLGIGTLMLALNGGTINGNVNANVASRNGFVGMGVAMVALGGGTLNGTVSGNTTDDNGLLGLGILSVGDNSNTFVTNNRADRNGGAIAPTIGAGIVFIQGAGNGADTNLAATVSGNTANDNAFLGIAAGLVDINGPAATPMTLTVANNTTTNSGAIGLVVFNFGGNLLAEVNSNSMTGDNTQNTGFGGGFVGASGAGADTLMNLRANTSAPANGFGFSFFDLGSNSYAVSFPPITTGQPVADNNSGTFFDPSGVIIP